MRIVFSNNLIFLGISIFVAWLFVRFLLVSYSERAVRAANAGRLISVGGRFGLLLTVRLLLDAMLLATIIVVTVGVLLNLYMSSFADTPSAISRVVWVRDQAERAVDSLRWFSAEAWIGCLVVLALVWLVASRSASRRSWEAALVARRAALVSALGDLSGEKLTERATTLDQKGVADLDRRTEVIASENTTRINALQNKAIIQLGEDPQNVMSLNNLRELEESMRQRAGDENADADDEERRRLVNSANTLRERIEEIEEQITVPLRTLEDTREVPLGEALADASGAARMKEKRETALRRLIVEAQLANHSIVGLSKARREPELISEWLASGATSVATVQTASRVGRASAFVCLLVSFLGYVGLGVLGLGPSLISEAAALELTLIARGAQADLAAATNEIATRDPDVQAPAETASESATVDFLRQSFRASVARTLQDSFRLTPRDRFDLASVEARQRILLASTRSAAPNLEGGRQTQTFDFSESVHRAEVQRSTAVLDEALDRRIQVLRQNEGLWLQLRMAAARPASIDLAGEAFLKTAFPTSDLADSVASRMWAERASFDFVVQTARTGRPPDEHYRVPSFSDEHVPLSVRDRRLVADYRSDAPQQIERALLGVREGSYDPGSLHRGLPGAPERGMPNPYGDYFPSGGGGGGGIGSGGGGGGGGGGAHPARAGPSSATRVATAPLARSYGKIRFSGRIGGVLIGSPPQSGVDRLDVRNLDWELIDSSLYLTITVDAESPKKLGPYHPAIAYHALAYAADGRVVTSTLPQPQSSDRDEIRVNARRILVHPAFEDTPFACSAIQVDRFVDAFTREDQGKPISGRINAARVGVTGLGILLGDTAAAYRAELLDELPRYVEPIAKHAQACGAGADCFPIAAYEKYGFKFGAASELLACLSRKEESKVCLRTLRSKPASATYLVDSGVREAAFRLDNKLTFLTGEDRAADPLWPLDFMIQAVPQTAQGDVSVDSSWDPWRFPTIDNDIKQAVASGVSNDADARVVLANMRDFTILQRLFRLALAGQLGFEFPLETLVKLQRAAAPFVKVERNERWNLNRPLFETLSAQHNELTSFLRSIAVASGAPEPCRAAANAAVKTEEDQHWPRTEGVWLQLGRVEKACTGIEAASTFRNRIRALRELDLVDQAISVVRSDRTSAAQFHCSPL
ncbi:putative membrane protein YgcG [Bradyrhizobium sp. USDA 4354]